MNETLQTTDQAFAFGVWNGPEDFSDMLAKLAGSGVLQLASGGSNSQENESAIFRAALADEHAALFQSIDSTCDGGRFQIQFSGEFTDAETGPVGRQDIENHELSGAEARLVKVVEVGSLYGLANFEPCGEKPRDLAILHFPRHKSIVRHGLA